MGLLRIAFLLALLPAAAFSITGVASAQDDPMRLLRSTPGHAAEKSTRGDAYADTTAIIAALQIQLREASPALPGSVALEFSADTGTARRASHLLLRIPLAGTAAPAQVGGTCKVDSSGAHTLVYTEPPAEVSAVPFATATHLTDLKFVLNQTLCHALAATYTCDGKPEAPQQDWHRWKLARTARVVLSSDAPAALALSPVVIVATDQPFSTKDCSVSAIIPPRAGDAHQVGPDGKQAERPERTQRALSGSSRVRSGLTPRTLLPLLSVLCVRLSSRYRDS